MAVVKVRLMTTHLDKHGERFTKEALECAKRQIDEAIIPQGIEHDPRIEPIGRILSAEIIQLGDGEFALEATNEIFDNYNNLADINDRELVTHSYPTDSLEIRSDRSYKDKSDIDTLNDISKILNCTTPPQVEIKKALEPLSVLWIGGAFILGGISAGFLNKMGSDAFDLLKSKLSVLFSKRKPSDPEKLLAFDFSIKGKHCNVELIITNPTNKELDYIFKEGLQFLDKELPAYFNLHCEKPIKKLVFELDGIKIKFKFGVRKDGIPVKIKERKK